MNIRERIIVGCGNFGGVGSVPQLFGKGESRVEAMALLEMAREFSLFRFDTANSYGGGASEEILGEFLQEQEPSFRQRMSVSTKVGNPFGAREGFAPLAASEIRFQLERSLKRLGVERIDVYYLHELPANVDLEETLMALDEALARGQISSFGLSNVSKPEVERVLTAAGERLGKFLTHVQNEFHFLNPDDRVELIPYLQKHGIKYTAYSPLAGGLLTGKYKLNRPAPTGSRLALRGEPYAPYLNEDHFAQVDAFIGRARSANVTAPAAALKFVLDTPGVDSAIIGPRRREHYEDLGFK